jgi:hypothetical protein
MTSLEILGNLACADCGSDKFRVNISYRKAQDRIEVLELECAACAIAQIECNDLVSEKDRSFVKPIDSEGDL